MKWHAVRRIKIEVFGVKGLEFMNKQFIEMQKSSKLVSNKGYEPWLSSG